MKIKDYNNMTLSDLEHEKNTTIHNMKVVWGHYIKNHIEMLECTGIDEDGSLMYTDDYEKLRNVCANDITMFESLTDKLKELNTYLERDDSNGETEV